MSTLTATVQFAPPSPHTGVQVVHSRLLTTSTATASSVILFGLVPNGCTIVDWIFYGDDASAGGTIKIGTSASESVIASDLSLCAEGQRAQLDKLPVRISLSDDVEPRSVMIQGILAATTSESADYRFELFYTMDGLPGRITSR